MSAAINIRIAKAEKRRLAAVAAGLGLTLSDFLRSSAVMEAHRVLGPVRLVVNNVEQKGDSTNDAA